MPEDKILQSIGELTGLVKASREDLKSLNDKYDDQSKNIQSLATGFAVMQNQFKQYECNTDDKIVEINEKLSRDYVTLNKLKTKVDVEEGIDSYKSKKRAYVQWFLGIIIACIGILTGVNQVMGIVDKAKPVTVVQQSSYAQSLKESPKDTIRIHVMGTDTIKGN